MSWIEHLQDRIAITRREVFVLLLLSGLYLSGLAVRHFEWLRPEAPVLTASSISPAPSAPDTAAIHLSPAPSDMSSTARLNLNTATAAELETLPRIGPKLAERIIAYRSAHGAFRRVRDLTRVSGIGDKTLAQLEPLLYVEQGE